MTVPKVSCIIPVTENIEYTKSINSIKCQTYNNIEILSISAPTLGEAINQNICNATGEYIAIILPEDEWAPEKIKTQIDYLENTPEILISGILHDSESINMIEFPQTKEELLVYMYTNKRPFYDSSLVFRRGLLDKIGKFKFALSNMCIFEFLLRGLTISDILFIDAPLVFSNKKPHPESISTLTEHEYNLAIYKSIKNMAPDIFIKCFAPYIRGIAKGVSPNIPCEKAMILSDLNNPFRIKEFTDLFETTENKTYFDEVCCYSLTDFYKTSLNPILFDKSYYNLCIKLNKTIESLSAERSSK